MHQTFLESKYLISSYYLLQILFVIKAKLFRIFINRLQRKAFCFALLSFKIIVLCKKIRNFVCKNTISTCSFIHWFKHFNFSQYISLGFVLKREDNIFKVKKLIYLQQKETGFSTFKTRLIEKQKIPNLLKIQEYVLPEIKKIKFVRIEET